MKQINRFLTFSQDDVTYRFLPGGDVFTFTNGSLLANQFRGNPKDGSVNNIYLRIYKKDGIQAYPLLGVKSGSKVSVSDSCLCQSGSIEGISYDVAFRPVGHIWFWDVTLSGDGQDIDLVYGQDLGVGPEGGVYTNELYMSQYLGHSVFRTENGYVVCSRQNMPADGYNPYVQQGVIGARAVHYSTDGLQFFGLSCKETGVPEALSGDLCDVNLQYEFAYTALQTEKLSLNGEIRLAFYGMFLANHADAVTGAEYREEILAAYKSLNDCCGQTEYREKTTALEPVVIKDEFDVPYSSPSFSKEEIDVLFPERRLEEAEGETLYSFFTAGHAHVVTKEKELHCDRPHGTIIITPPDEEKVNSALIASTQYMYGIFNSHVVCGNTDVHKFISTPRGFLNLQHNSGQRLYVRLDGKYRLLSLPGLFEMGMNYSKWYYKLPGDLLTVTAYTTVDTADLKMTVSSKNDTEYDFILTSQLTMGPQEYAHDIEYTTIKDGLRFTLDTPQYPGMHYDLVLPDCDFTASDDSIFFADGKAFDETFLTLSIHGRSSFDMCIRGRLDDNENIQPAANDFEVQRKAALSYYEKLVCHFHLEGGSDSERTGIMNETIWWYAHNAMIHFSMPHGLEQPGGAAWGCRDICQGPMEFFLTTQHYELAKGVLLDIFAHQNTETREWPQWFMFDRYKINAGECHGDVIFWPLKCVADYLTATGDLSILSELVAYDNAPEQEETLLSHIRLALSNIKETRLIGDTGLITYAGGDWDDTLQPANDELKQRLVSAWTEALAYQTFHSLSDALKGTAPELAEELNELAALTKSAFENILIKDGVIAGFLECNNGYTYMLHPSDNNTGIHYRLLPMTRSIISELVSPEQAEKNVSLIQDNLKCPDGVRLMDKPARYEGGVSKLFRRAEQAANVGREISLQYTHAHIRYIEAMAKIGNGQEAWDSLFVINPIHIQNTVPNARIRQSNMYFSSSEGAYNDRYDYAENFGLLRTGSIEVKGGWRLYSSGPGIYLRQLIANVLGIRFDKDGLIIDSVLPKSMDGLCFTYDCFGKTFTFRYHLADAAELTAKADGELLAFTRLDNPYRKGGIHIAKDVLADCGDVIDIFA